MTKYPFVSGLLLGAGVGGHALRLVELSAAPVDGQLGRYFVAISAILLYGTASVLAGLGYHAGLWIAIIGPLIGVSAVLLLGGRVDSFQLALGVFQVIGAVVSAWLLWRA